jgi:hypothetical protein
MKPAEPIPVKFFMGVLYREASLLNQVKQSLEKLFGKIDYGSPEFNFDFSGYYAAEMGSGIFRCFFSFHKLIDPGRLAEIKIQTNQIENEFALAGKRRINLDPGYMDFNKVILASAKFNSQKIYLGHGIYADPALWYEKGRFTAYPSAFPDFKSELYQEAFLHIRALYKRAGVGAT